MDQSNKHIQVNRIQYAQLSVEERNSRFTETVKVIASELAALVAEKNAAYGDSFADTPKFLELLYPDGIRPAQFEDALALVRVFDKMKRIATKKDAFGENPWHDVGGYSLVSLTTAELRKVVRETMLAE